jgi:hypothetical protein
MAPAGGTVFLDSTDGAAWHRQPGKDGWHPYAIAVGRAGILAIGGIGGHAATWKSSDGLAWTASRDAFPTPATGTDALTITDVVADGDGWLAVGRRDPDCQLDCGLEPNRSYVWRSSNGADWTRLADQASLKGGGMVAVARGDHGFVAAGVASDHAAIWTSPDGQAWSRVHDDPMFHGPQSPDGPFPVGATGVAAHDRVVVVVGMTSFADPPSVRAWWSADGRTWSKASIEKAAGGQLFSVSPTPVGFLAVGPSGGKSCRGGIWASSDGRAWRCVASGRGFEGFSPYAAAASDTIEVVVGLTDAGVVEESPDGFPGDTWTRPLH